VPTISRFMGIVITMYFDDHPPPHFHARAAERSAKIRIDTLEVIASDLHSRELRLVLAWARRGTRLKLASSTRRCHTEGDRATPMIGLTPDITDVVVTRHGRLRLTFADGLTGEADVLDRMRGPVFERARTTAGFDEVRVDPETGTVCWPDGADLAPDTLYERVRTGLWPDQSRAA
jgi:hypothetical protein